MDDAQNNVVGKNKTVMNSERRDTSATIHVSRLP